MNVLASERPSQPAAAVGMVGLECRCGSKMSEVAIALGRRLVRDGAESISSTVSSDKIICLGAGPPHGTPLAARTHGDGGARGGVGGTAGWWTHQTHD